MREPGRRRTDVLGGVLNEQTVDHPFVVSSVPAAGCRQRRRGTTGESGEGERGLAGRIRWRRDGTSSRHRLLRQLGCDAVRTGCAGGPRLFRVLPFPSHPQDRRDGVGIGYLPAYRRDHRR